MPHRPLIVALAFCAAVLGACAKSSGADPLSRELDAASNASPSIQLAPTGGRTDVVSVVERSPETRPAPRPTNRQPRPTPRRSPAPAVMVASAPPAVVAPEPRPVQATAAPVPSSDARRPQPQAQAEHHGRYSTEAEVIRNAPFPILP